MLSILHIDCVQHLVFSILIVIRMKQPYAQHFHIDCEQHWLLSILVVNERTMCSAFSMLIVCNIGYFPY